MTAPGLRAGASVLGAALATAAAAAHADPHLAPVRLTPQEIAGLHRGGAGAGTSGVAGIQATVLAGDPTRPGPYAIEIRVPANTRIQAHHHRDDRTAVVVSGTWRFGYGPKADDALAKPLGPGAFYTEPAGEAHFAMTGGEPVILYVTGFGPTDTTYESAAGDPR